jgi:hypothetical protein
MSAEEEAKVRAEARSEADAFFIDAGTAVKAEAEEAAVKTEAAVSDAAGKAEAEAADFEAQMDAYFESTGKQGVDAEWDVAEDEEVQQNVADALAAEFARAVSQSGGESK